MMNYDSNYHTLNPVSTKNFTFSRISFATKLYRPLLSQKYQFDNQSSIRYDIDYICHFTDKEVLCVKVYYGISASSGTLQPLEAQDFPHFCEIFFNKCSEGTKDGPYFTTASKVDELHRDNVNHLESHCVCIDGDQKVGDPKSCIEPKRVHEVLKRKDINHFIYTSFSHSPPDKHKWRLVVPCKITSLDEHKATVAHLHKLLFDNGLNELVAVKESFNLSQLWYLPRSKDPSVFQTFSHFTGKDFPTHDQYPNFWSLVPTPTKTKPEVNEPEPETTSYDEIIHNIETATHPIHDSINLFIYGSVKDGLPRWRILKDLNRMSEDWDLEVEGGKLQGYKNDFERLVDTAIKKFSVEQPEYHSHWTEETEAFSNVPRIFTNYPDQGGMMEELVQCCLDWMVFPNRQIAVTAARAVISTLGARVYTFEGGKGIALTCLITGRSTIGKSNIKKFFLWLMDNFQLANTSQEFIGDQYYTSVKNMVKDVNDKTSLLSVRTESGQSDKSKAGDMARVMAYELEFSTESGAAGYISGGGQNDKIPPLFSPAVTTIRESVAKIQSDADAMNQSVVAGVSGRRSLVLIDVIKGNMNPSPITKIPKRIKDLIIKLYSKASDDRRKDCSQPLNPKLWVTFEYEDPKYMQQATLKWLECENRAALLEDDYESTFYGRLYERVPAYAGSLAIADNPDKPVITNRHLEIAEASLMAELNAHRHQETSGELDDPLSRLISKIEKVFHGSMVKELSWYKPALKKIGKKELQDGAMEWSPLSRKLRRYIAPLDRRDKDAFFRSLGIRLRAVDISILSNEETQERYGHKRMTLRRM